MCVCVYMSTGAYEAQKRALIPVESPDTGIWNQTLVIYKSSKCY